jgi:hypothetical protein
MYIITDVKISNNLYLPRFLFVILL